MKEGERRIRLARVEDAEAIAALHVRGWQAAYRGILSDEFLDGLDVAEWARRRRAAIEKPTSPEVRWWVLERRGAIEGMAMTGPSRDADAGPGEFEVYAIYVEPTAIGRGLGRALMDHALADLASRGAADVVLWVFEDNARARTFYEKAGFRLDDGAAPRPFRDTKAVEVRYRGGASPRPAG
jgi:ribosomal protein S18 acetylase RimI-like enzyme